MERRSERIGDVWIHYLFSGCEDNQVVVLLPGLGMSPSLYEDLGELLSKSYLVVIPDLNGLGDSGLIVETLEALAESYGWGKVYLIAHSMGGLVALRWAAAFPERVGEIVGIDIAGQKVKRNLPGWGLVAMKKNLRNFRRNRRKAAEIVVSFVRQSLLHPGWMWEAFRITTQCDAVAAFREIKADISLVWAYDDEYFPSCIRLAQAVRGEPTIIRNAGHDWMILESTEAAIIIESLLT